MNWKRCLHSDRPCSFQLGETIGPSYSCLLHPLFHHSPARTNRSTQWQAAASQGLQTATVPLQQSGDTPSYAIGKIPTGLPTLDSYLHGGIPIGSIAEVVGRAGVGKTHLAQQLCVVAAKLNGGAVYIDAEKKLSLLRLREIAFERYLADQNDSDAGQQPPQERHAHELAQRVLENVSVHGLLTTRELMDLLDGLEDEIILRNSQAAACKQQRENTANASSTGKLPVRLIVIDSIAAPIKRDFDMIGSSSNTVAHRASAIFQIAK